MAEQRIREMYADYQKGLIPFQDLIRASDEFLERWEQDRRVMDIPLIDPKETVDGRQGTNGPA